MTDVLGPRQTKWVEALESGEFTQIRSWLKSKEGYCCLGVACEVAGIEPVLPAGYQHFLYGNHSRNLPKEAQDFFGFRNAGGIHNNGSTSLTHMNDTGRTFAEIAAAVRAKPSEFFEAPK